MKKKLNEDDIPDILKDRFVFDTKSGSMGNITAVIRGNSNYFRAKSNCKCPNTDKQKVCQNATARANKAWAALSSEQQKLWNDLGYTVHVGSMPGDTGEYWSGKSLFTSCYLKLASIGHEGVPEPLHQETVPSVALTLASVSELEHGRDLRIECKPTPKIPQGYCMSARIRVYVQGCGLNSGYMLKYLGQSGDGSTVVFILPDYRRVFNIKTLKNKLVSLRIEYDLTDIRSGRHWIKPQVITPLPQFKSRDNYVSEVF